MRNVMLTVLALVAGVFAQVPTAGLQAYFPFTAGSLTDESIYLHSPLTAYGAPAPSVPCADHNGTTDAARDFYPGYTAAGALYRLHSGLPASNADRSVCFWINRSGSTDSTAGIVLWGKRPSGHFGIYMRNINGVYYLIVRGFAQPCSVRVSVYTDQTYMSIGSWHLVAVTYSAGDLRISVDNGPQTAFVVGSTNTDTTGDTLNIGAYRYGVGSIRAKLDEVCVYNRALTTSDIAQLYQPVSVLCPMKHNTQAIQHTSGIRSCDLLGRYVLVARTFSSKVYAGEILVQ